MRLGPHSTDYFKKLGFFVLLCCVIFGIMTLYATLTYPPPARLKLDPHMQQEFDKAIEEVLRKAK